MVYKGVPFHQHSPSTTSVGLDRGLPYWPTHRGSSCQAMRRDSMGSPGCHKATIWGEHTHLWWLGDGKYMVHSSWWQLMVHWDSRSFWLGQGYFFWIQPNAIKDMIRLCFAGTILICSMTPRKKKKQTYGLYFLTSNWMDADKIVGNGPLPEAAIL